MEMIVFGIVVLIAIAEIVVSARWNRWYFTVGVPIFRRRIDRAEGLAGVDLDALQKSTATVAGTPLLFRTLDSGVIAFREKAFGGSIHYAPLMRGVIRHDPGEPSVVVLGLVNWTMLALVLALLWLVRGDLGDATPWLIGTFAILYLIQGVRYGRVAKALRR